MDEVISLWLPILVSAVSVFILSSIVWMVLPHHKADINMIPEDKERRLFEALSEMGLDPKLYMFPNCEKMQKAPKEERASLMDKWRAGPHGTLSISAGAPSFGRNLLLTFLSYLIISIFVGYLASFAVAPGAEFMEVFRFAGTAGVLAYVFGSWPNAFFMGKRPRFMLTDSIDGIIYGLETGFVFAILWPALESAAPAIPGG